MQKSLTWLLTAAALGLFAFIVLYERKLPDSATRQLPPKLLGQVLPSDVTAVEVGLPSGGVVRAERSDRTENEWTLVKPVYPAQQSSLDTFVTNVVQLRRLDAIPPEEIKAEGAKAFGLDPPRATVQLETATNRFRFEVGGPAPLTNNVYLRLQPSGEVFLAQADFLGALPKTTNDWRDRDLLSLARRPFDHLQVRLGQRVFELARNATNNVWQITKPYPARGDQARIATLLEQLGTSRVAEFVTDAPADLERYGLQSPALELELLRGTNQVLAIDFGAAATNRTNHVYAQLRGTNVVAVEEDLLEQLKLPYKAFHDPRLVTLNPARLARIDVRSIEKFSIERQPDGRWVAGEAAFPVDLELLGRFLGAVLDFRILDIVKEVPTDADLQGFGLQNPIASFAFVERSTNAPGAATNTLELNFGIQQADRVYARRSDEAPVYVTELAKLYLLPRYAFEVRDRQIWNFPGTNVVRVTLIDTNGTRTIRRSGGSWLADPLANAAVGEIVHRLSRLKVGAWIAKGEERKKAFGIVEGAPVLEVELKTGEASEVRRIDLGRETLRHDIYGTTPLPGAGEPLIFEFPGEIYHLMLQHFPAPGR